MADFFAVVSELTDESSAAISASLTDMIKASEDTRDQTHQEV